MKKSYDSKFKSRVVLEAIRGEKSIAEIAGKYNTHPNPVVQWKKKLMEASSDVFATRAEKAVSVIMRTFVYPIDYGFTLVLVGGRAKWPRGRRVKWPSKWQFCDESTELPLRRLSQAPQQRVYQF